jgi:GR25 family glycosyltransferase involved in LPS biosynthesis
MIVKVITLPGATNRQDWISNNVSIPFSFHWAIDGHKYKLSHKLVNPPTVATFLTHTNLWLQLRDLNSDKFLILEDDIKIENNFQILDEKIKTLPEDWDIAFVGWYNTNYFGKPRPINDDWVFVERFWGLHAYIVKKSSINKIYNSIVNIDTHIDVQLSRLITSNLIKGYFLKSPVINQSGNFPSQIKEQ